MAFVSNLYSLAFAVTAGCGDPDLDVWMFCMEHTWMAKRYNTTPGYKASARSCFPQMEKVSSQCRIDEAALHELMEKPGGEATFVAGKRTLETECDSCVRKSYNAYCRTQDLDCSLPVGTSKPTVPTVSPTEFKFSSPSCCRQCAEGRHSKLVR
jgi:hypothetical protein